MNRQDLQKHIGLIVSVIDNHDAGIHPDNGFVCPCKFRGSEQEWLAHVADVIATRLEERVVQLPLEHLGEN